jgi:hypothetical protein
MDNEKRITENGYSFSASVVILAQFWKFFHMEDHAKMFFILYIHFKYL